MSDSERKRKHNRRRELRANASIAEHILWNQLRQKRLGFKFRRQHSIGEYIVDFYCHEAKLVVEVDGAQHGTKEAMDYDKRRDAALMKEGNIVVSFTAWTVCENMEGVYFEIKRCCEERTGKTPP